MDLCVVGNLNVDLVLGRLHAVPPWGAEAVVDECQIRFTGAAGSVARAAAAFGMRVAVVGAVGNDVFGDRLLTDLASHGIEITGVCRASSHGTGLSVGVVREDRERLFVTYLGALAALDDAWIANYITSHRPSTVLMCGLYLAPGVSVAALADMFKCVRSYGGQTMLDTGWNPRGWSGVSDDLGPVLRETAVFLPNEGEALGITSAGDVSDAAARLVEMGPGLVIVKRGPDGCLAATRQGLSAIPAADITVGDTVGAGDAFNAGVVYGLGQKWALPRILRFASAGTALTIRQGSRVYPSVGDVLDVLDGIRT